MGAACVGEERQTPGAPNSPPRAHRGEANTRMAMRSGPRAGNLLWHFRASSTNAPVSPAQLCHSLITSPTAFLTLKGAQCPTELQIEREGEGEGEKELAAVAGVPGADAGFVFFISRATGSQRMLLCPDVIEPHAHGWRGEGAECSEVKGQRESPVYPHTAAGPAGMARLFLFSSERAVVFLSATEPRRQKKTGKHVWKRVWSTARERRCCLPAQQQQQFRPISCFASLENDFIYSKRRCTMLHLCAAVNIGKCEGPPIILELQLEATNGLLVSLASVWLCSATP